jgi:hypothetical protein
MTGVLMNSKGIKSSIKRVHSMKTDEEEWHVPLLATSSQ